MGELCAVFLFWKFDAGWEWWLVLVLFIVLQVFSELRKIRRRWVEQKQYEQMWDYMKEKK